MTDTGLLNAASCADNSGVGGAAWTSTANAAGAQNGTVANVDLSGTATSHYLIGSFTHGLAAGDTIVGVKAAFYRFASLNDSDAPQDFSVKLVKNGTVGGNNKANVGVGWPQSGAWSSDYGGAADTWGLSFTGSDTIGLAVSVAAQDPNDNASIDAMRVTIYYTPAGGGTVQSMAFFM